MTNVFVENLIETIAGWSRRVKCLGVVVMLLMLMVGGYWMMIQSTYSSYVGLLQEEPVLRTQFETAYQQASQLPAYRKQWRDLTIGFNKMMGQLPTQNEMPALFEEISMIGINSGLTFELFAPQTEIMHDFFMELPIHLIVIGYYQQLAIFLSRIAQMDRLVTLYDFEVTPYVIDSEPAELRSEKITELLLMKMVVKTYWAGNKKERTVVKHPNLHAPI